MRVDWWMKPGFGTACPEYEYVSSPSACFIGSICTRPLNDDFGDVFADFFGIDSGAIIGLEYRFGIVKNGQIGVLRQNSKTVRFRTAREMLETFGLQTSGSNYRRMIEGFQRIFASTIYFGTEDQQRRDLVFDWARFHYFDRMQLWFNRHDQDSLPGGEFENVIELSDSFWKEIQNHPIPVDAEVVKGLSDAPGNLDFYMWLSWRCYKSTTTEYINLCGPGGLERLGRSRLS